MKYHHAIREKLEADGFMVSVQHHGEIFTVSATREGKTHIAQTENLTASFLEVSRSIAKAESLAE